MGEREEILKLVRGFRQMQERLASEREARMDKLTQQTRKHLAEMYSRDITSSVAQQPLSALRLAAPVWGDDDAGRTAI